MLQVELFGLLEETADAAYSTNEIGEICSWNQAAARLFGHAASAALGRICSDLLEGRGALGTPACPDHCRLAVSGLHIPNFDLEIRTGSGLWIWVAISTLLFRDSRTGEHLVVHLAHEITQN